MPSGDMQDTLGILIIPGMTEQRDDYSPIIKCLQEEGYVCSFLEPDGYGMCGEDTDWKNWLRQSRDAVLGMKKHFGPVYALGHSAGALLSLILGEEHLVDGVVSLAAPLVLRKESLRPVKRRLFSQNRECESIESRKESSCHRYIFSHRRIRNVRRLGMMTQMNLGQLRCPVLIAQGDEDPFSEWESLERIREGCQSVYMQQVTPDGYLDLKLETEGQMLKERLLDFLSESNEMRRSAETEPIMF